MTLTSPPRLGPAAESLDPPSRPGLPARTPEAGDQPRSLNARTTDDLASLLGSFVAALSFVWICYEHILDWSGILGFIVSCWVVFVCFYAGVSAIGNPRPIVIDRLMGVVVRSGALLVVLVLGSLVYYVYYRGWPAYRHLNFFTQDMNGVRPTDSLNRGGILHAIIGSGWEIGIATAISLPLGVGTAVYLSEVGGPISVVVRTVVEAMTALPDILAGLFVYTVLIITFHQDRTGVIAALALSVTMIPIVARSAEVVLRVVPGGLREAGLALGASKWQTVWRVVLPTARPGLATALILGVARIAGESAPLIIVVVPSTVTNGNPLSGRFWHDPMNSLPFFIVNGVRNSEVNYQIRGYGAAAVLLTLVLVLFSLTRFLARNKVGSR